ncbi:MAG: hypothetical protein GQ532_10860 [Methylomarinum sp.]|nr:hypothetical protein [Methylomarinum sp.]
MFSTPSKILAVLLVLLQFIAPLVHAHANEGQTNQGIHLPELEHFHSKKSDNAYFSSTQPSCTDDCLTINIGTGIKQNKAATDHAAPVYFLPESFTFKLVINLIQINAPPSKQILFPAVSIRLLPSRAPPKNT